MERLLEMFGLVATNEKGIYTFDNVWHLNGQNTLDIREEQAAYSIMARGAVRPLPPVRIFEEDFRGIARMNGAAIWVRGSFHEGMKFVLPAGQAWRVNGIQTLSSRDYITAGLFTTAILKGWTL